MAKKRIALVTGGMGGLGEAICIKLAALGDTVVTTYSPGNTKSQAWLGDMKKQGHTFYAYPCDVTDWNSCLACVQKVSAEVGPVDVLVNNAGITRDMTFKKMDRINWDAVMHTNLDSVFNMSKQVCDGMVDRGWGRIINISSVEGKVGKPVITAYVAAKHGILGLTKGVAREVGTTGVTVNAICPGLILTDIVMENGPRTAAAMGISFDEMVALYTAESAIQRPVTVEEVGSAAVMLASDLGSGITGAAISVDGGTSPY